MGINFLSRHTGYKIGLVSLYVTTILFFAGNFIPQWLTYSRTATNVRFRGGTIDYLEATAHSSAVVGCSKERQHITFDNGGFSSSESHGCGTGFYVESVAGGWVHACQAFEWIAILALLSVCIYTIWVNFFKKVMGTKNFYAEIVVVASGVLGFLGTVIFAGKMGSTVSGSDSYSFAWSLFFTMVISIIIVVIGILMAIFSRK